MRGHNSKQILCSTVLLLIGADWIYRLTLKQGEHPVLFIGLFFLFLLLVLIVSGLNRKDAWRKTTPYESESSYDSILSGVIEYDACGKILEVNNQARKILGNRLGTFTACTDEGKQVGIKDRQETPLTKDNHPVLYTYQSRKPVHNAVLGISHPEECGHRWFLINTNPVLEGKAGKLTKVVANFTEITQIVETEKQLTDNIKQLKKLSLLDGLTNIPNRRYFDLYYSDTWEEMKASKKPICIMILDLDYFKRFNDTYGHLAGDEGLRSVATLLVKEMEDRGKAFRFGGEEFIVVLPGVSASEGIKIAELLSQSIKGLNIPHNTSEVGPYLSASIGIAATIPTDSDDRNDLIQLADDQLYEAKRRRCCRPADLEREFA